MNAFRKEFHLHREEQKEENENEKGRKNQQQAFVIKQKIIISPPLYQ